MLPCGLDRSIASALEELRLPDPQASPHPDDKRNLNYNQSLLSSTILLSRSTGDRPSSRPVPVQTGGSQWSHLAALDTTGQLYQLGFRGASLWFNTDPEKIV